MREVASNFLLHNGGERRAGGIWSVQRLVALGRGLFSAPSNPQEPLSEQLCLQLAFAVLLCLLGIVTLWLLALLAFWQNKVPLGYLDVLMSLFLLGALPYLRRPQLFATVLRVVLAGVGLFFFGLLISGGAGNTGFLWLHLFPLIAFFLLGARRGVLISLALFLPAVLYLSFEVNHPFLAHYPLDLRLRLISSLLLVHLIAYLHESVREKNGLELENIVERRTGDLRLALDLMRLEVKGWRVAEQRLQRSRRDLLTILDSIDAVVFVVEDESDQVLFMNKTARERFGEGEGKKCWQVFRNRQTGPCPDCGERELFVGQSEERERPAASGRHAGCWYAVSDFQADRTGEKQVRVRLALDISERVRVERARATTLEEWRMQVAQRPLAAEIIPICSYCGDIRDGAGMWRRLETYVAHRCGARFSHTICGKCSREHFPEIFG